MTLYLASRLNWFAVVSGSAGSNCLTSNLTSMVLVVAPVIGSFGLFRLDSLYICTNSENALSDALMFYILYTRSFQLKDHERCVFEVPDYPKSHSLVECYQSVLGQAGIVSTGI